VTRAAFGLASYSFPFSCGFAKRDGRGIDHPLDAFALIDLAHRLDLAGIEIPFFQLLPDMEPATIDRMAQALRERGMTFLLDTAVLDVAVLRTVLPLAKRAGATTVRAMLAGFLEGARAVHVPNWSEYMRQSIVKLMQIHPLLEELDLRLAIENHQDATSEDLLALCSVGPRIGVTFDVVNPLAVGEEPFDFARKLGSRIFNVHLKDYTIHPTASGYRLARAALGEGVIDWPAMVDLVRGVAPAATWHIELAAIYARHIRLYEADWWRGYSPRSALDLLPLLRFVARHAQPPDAPWQTPWERGADFDECERYEREQFERSVDYLRRSVFRVHPASGATSELPRITP
jgi:sugar phosphate isomerase/epimerase